MRERGHVLLPHFRHTDRAFGDWMLEKVPDLAIDEHTCVPEWHAGETIDWDFAVSLLFDHPGAGAIRH